MDSQSKWVEGQTMRLDEEKGWEVAEGQRDRGGTKGEPVGVVFIVLQNL